MIVDREGKTFAQKVQETGVFKRLVRKAEPKFRSSTKALAAGGATLLTLTASPVGASLGDRFHNINDWDSLIVLVVTWLVSRLTKSPSDPGKL